MNNLLKELLNFDSAAISDALDSCKVESALSGIRPIVFGKKLIGPAFTVKYTPYETKPIDFKGAGDYIDDVPEHSVIVIDNNGREDCTTWGSVLTQVALIKNIAGTVVHGSIRDVEFIRNNEYALFSRAIYMRSGKNRVYKSEQQKTIVIGDVIINPGDIIFGDDNGVLSIPKNLLEDIIYKVKNIFKTEENIINAVKSGASLKEARIKHHYHAPWIKDD